MSDSLITAVMIVMILLNILVISGGVKNYASINSVGWGEVPPLLPTSEGTALNNDSNDGNEGTESTNSMESTNSTEGTNNTESTERDPGDQNTNLYGRQQEEYDGYITAYTDCWNEPKPVIVKSCAEQDNSIDSANVMMAQKRARDKRCMDGLVSKDANFYRHHYANELGESENKVWWGRADY